MSSTATIQSHEIIEIDDDSPELMPPAPTLIDKSAMAQPVDPKDPEGFLRRCSGYNKKKNVRCSAIIGRNSHHSKNSHSTFLPTCHAHRDQQSYAGWCQFVQKDGERCARLFRWTPPYFELCAEHQGHPDTPCYLMKLPIELRLEIFRYLLPTRAIGSSTSLLHIDEDPDQQQPWYHTVAPPNAGPANNRRNSHAQGPNSLLDRTTMRSVFPIPFLNLALINRQVHDEVKDLLYSTVPFTIDVRKDGTFMCGRRLLEPRRADGSSHYVVGDVDKIKEKFIKTFDWMAVKNYNVDILVENWKDDTNRGYHTFPWDEEVEIYDIRDYIGVVVSGILSKAKNLCKLNVRLGFSKFIWSEEELHTNIKTLVGPFERLRNVRQPRFLGVYEGTPQTNFMISLPIASQATATNFVPVSGPSHVTPSTPLCSVPQLPTKISLLICNQPAFTGYRHNWERWISSTSTTSLVCKPPIRTMFTQLKEFYTRLAVTVPDVTARNGRHSFLHRARVAREQENVEAFRDLRNELISYWEAYLEQEERKKDLMNGIMSRMLDVDVYPASWDDDHVCVAGPSSSATHSVPSSNSQSPIISTTESWRNAAKNAQRSNSQRRSFHSHHTQVEASSSKSNSGATTRDPFITDMANDGLSYADAQLQNALRQQQLQMQHQQSMRQHCHAARGPLQSSTSSGDLQTSPLSPKTTLDQQPMALNPQLHLEAAMSHRRRVEMQAHRARAMQEAARRHALEQAQKAAGQPQMPGSGPTPSSPSVSHSPVDPMVAAQIGRQIVSQDSTVFVNMAASGSTIPWSSLDKGIDPWVSASMSYQQRSPPPPSAYTVPGYSYHPYSYDFNNTIPHAEPEPEPEPKPAVHVYEASSSSGSNKRTSSEVEVVEMANGKRRRVDSGMGWSTEGAETAQQAEGNEDGEGDEDTGGEMDVQRERYAQCKVERQQGRSWVQSSSFKGKGKARAEEPEVVWLD